MCQFINKRKKRYYSNLDHKMFDNNKLFWQQIKPLFSDKKGAKQDCVTIVENSKTYTENKEVAEKLNNFFVDAVDELGIQPFVTPDESKNCSDKISDIVASYETHPSIVKIKENVQVDQKFIFTDITSSIVQEEIKKLNPKKSCINNDIPAKILISSSDLVSECLSKIYNECKDRQEFPTSMKIADVILVYKPNEKNEKTLKKNYRPISLTPLVSKVFERHMFKEIRQISIPLPLWL